MMVCGGLPFPDIGCPVPNVYIYYVPNMVNVCLVFLHLSTTLGCFRPRTFFSNKRLDKTEWAAFISDLHTKLRIISRGVPDYADWFSLQRMGRGWIYIVSTLAHMIWYDTTWVFFEGILKNWSYRWHDLIWTIISLTISPRIRWLVVVIIQVAFICIYSGQMSSSLCLPMLWLLKVQKCLLDVFESWIWLCCVNNTKLGAINWGLGKHYTVVNFGHHRFR